MMKFRSKSRDSSHRSNTKPEYFAPQTDSPRSVTSSPAAADEVVDLDTLRQPRTFEDTIPVPMAPDGRIRSKSAQRTAQPPLQSNSMRIVGRDEQRSSPEPIRRAISAGRQRQVEPAESSESSDKKRKSKIEKIRQLQAKNELYKEEFKRVQKDRKKLKKELEAKNNELVSLTKEIDGHVAETSKLKSQLSEAMVRLERNDDTEERDQATIMKLAKELAQTKDDFASALRRVTTLKQQITDLQEYIRRKDEQIETLTLEVSNQETRLIALEEQNKELKRAGENGKKNGHVVKGLVAENEKLQEELSATLERAATMVKEREDAIADLLKENDELRSGKLVRPEPDVSHEELDQLREELNSTNASLEEAQDRNILLEEEIEAWLARGTEMENMLDQLNSDLEDWQRKAMSAEESVEKLQAQLVDSKADAASAREALRTAEAKHASVSADMETKHKAAVKELEEKMFADRVEKPTESQQAMLLQKAVLQQAVADQQKKAQQSSWRRFLNKGSDDEDDTTSSGKRLKELETLNDEQAEEIKKLKSELVRLRSSHNEAAYLSKKTIERLTEENEVYVERVKALEEKLLETTQ